MTPGVMSELLSAIKITDVYRGLGGKLEYKRGRAFWREGEHLNVAFDDAKGVWRDHVAAASSTW